MQWTTSSPWFTNQAHPITKSRFDPSTHCMLVIIHPSLWNKKWTNAWLEFANSTLSLIWTRRHIWIWLGGLEGFKLQRRSLITNSRLMIDENLYLIDHASSWMLQLKLNAQFHKSAYNPKYDHLPWSSMVVNIGIKKRGKCVTRFESHILPNIFVGHPYISWFLPTTCGYIWWMCF